MTTQSQLGFLDWLADLDRRIEAALRSPVLDRMDKEILSLLASHKGRARAIPSREIIRQLGLKEGEEGRRVVTRAVESLLLLAKIRVGASRTPPMGYFLIVDQADCEHAIRPRWAEVYAQLRVLCVLVGAREVAKLFGRAMNDLRHRGAA